MAFVCRVTVGVPGSHQYLTRTALNSTSVIENSTGHGKRDSRAKLANPRFTIYSLPFTIASVIDIRHGTHALLTICESLNSSFNANQQIHPISHFTPSHSSLSDARK